MGDTHLATGAGWSPDAAAIDRSRLLDAARRWGFPTLADLHAASVGDPERFWRLVIEDLRIEFSADFDRVRDDRDGDEFPRWFTGGRINVTDMCAHRHATDDLAERPAVVYEGDSGQHRVLTFAELDREVRRFAANLAALGVGAGDRVVLFLPVVPEATVAFLACAMLGAISVPAFSGYGPEALAMRLRGAEATVLVTADGTTRRGQNVPMKATADEALADAPTVEHVVVVNHLGSPIPMTAGRDVYWEDLPADPAPVETYAAAANAPLMIVYTSGTTGAPKGIVHSHAGFLVKAAVDFAYGFDIHRGEVIAWIADMGWLLGPLLIVGGLQLGATIVLTEGVPNYPSPARLWEIAERNAVTLQGIAPTAARVIAAAGAPPVSGLESVLKFASTGEAWDEPTWRWLFEQVGRRRRPIINYSGGTEVGGGILISYPFLPVGPSGFNAGLPGVDAAVFDEHGQPVVGQVGELVLRSTFPGMTHGFWRDRERYLETYWSMWPGIWRHGDLASVSDAGEWLLHGRSDDTIKVSGRRVGPAEIESALLKDQRIVEAAVIGVPDELRGQRVVAFVVLRDGVAGDDDLVASAERNVGRSFAPTIIPVASLPKTKNGKVMRRAIRAQHLGTPVGDMSSLDPATPLEAIPLREQPAQS
jgi:acetyl-CoA synthetase